MTAATTAQHAELRDALHDANLPALLIVLHQLTGEECWLRDPYRPTPGGGLGDHDTGGLDDAIQAEIREAAFEAIVAWREGRLQSPVPPSADRAAELLSVMLAEEIPRRYSEFLTEEMGFSGREVTIAVADRSRTAAIDVLVIGAGLAGINIAIALRNAGVPFRMVEKNRGVGGTWLENRYPGCGVDTPSHLYSFSFAPRSGWRHYFARRIQLLRYFEDLAMEHGLYADIEFGTEVLSARWVDHEQRWLVKVRDANGAERLLPAKVLVSAVGHFNRPSIPRIEGLESFDGPCMHTSQWDDGVVVEGKRVGVVGSGASAMQLVPALAGTADRVLVFQRSRQWCVPHPNCGREVSPRVSYLLEHLPFYAAWYRARHFWRFGDRLHPALQVDPDYPHPERAINEVNEKSRRFLTDYIRRELEGRPDLIEASIPDYPPYGKRPLIDHGWYRTIRREDVELIEGSVASIHGKQVVLADGRAFEVDVLALATGFKTLEILGPMEIIGRSGRRLRETWGKDDARAYLGITVPDFPNLFLLYGPNTATGHGGSAFLTTEMQVRYVMQMLAHMIAGQITSVECRREVHDAYNDELDAALSRTVWAHPKVDNYYRNAASRIVGTSPWEYVEYWERTRHAQLGDYELTYARANGRSSTRARDRGAASWTSS